jgi:dTDP-3-amino-3,4,6-trideoxy-alpha-D-glucose transaminase
MFVPFIDLKRESGPDRDEMQQAITRVLKSGRFVLGPELEALEAEFARYLGVPCAAGVASGTDALTLALEATGVIQSPGRDEVITPVLSAAFTALAVCRAGAVPRFVDVDPVTLQMDPERIEPIVRPHTRALLPVHLYGHACDLPRIEAVARRHGLALIEDACQAHGSRLKGRALGTSGNASGFSFYPTKNLGALGDAGMVVTSDHSCHERVRKLRHGGQSRAYWHELPGFNSRLDEIQAAVLRGRLARLESKNERRREMADRYDQAFAGLSLAVLPVSAALLPNRHLYPVRTPQREKLRAYLSAQGVETLVHYPVPLHLQPALRQFVLPGQEFPVADKAAREVFSLPLYPELTEEEQQHVIRCVRGFFREEPTT